MTRTLGLRSDIRRCPARRKSPFSQEPFSKSEIIIHLDPAYLRSASINAKLIVINLELLLAETAKTLATFGSTVDPI
jgi:hypothetical protein